MKMNFFKKAVFPIVIVFFTCLISSNSVIAQSNIDWTLKSESQGVKFSYKVENCTTGNVVFFQFENTNNNQVAVIYHVVLNGNTTDLPLPQNLSLGANEIISGQCQGTPHLSKATDSPSNPILNFSMTVNN